MTTNPSAEIVLKCLPETSISNKDRKDSPMANAIESMQQQPMSKKS